MTANQLWWIALGVLFVWMMWRGGCGMAMRRGRRRGGHASHASHGEAGAAIDPVCRMSVDPAKAAGTRVREGETYFFCSQSCLDAFDTNAAMYVHPAGDTRQHRHHGC